MRDAFEDQKIVLKDCTERLERLRIPYMLSGSMAMIPYAMMRTDAGHRFLAGIDLWIISKEDLILSKLNWAKETKSEIQMRYVASIIRNGYDEVYVQPWVDQLGLNEMFSEVKEMLKKNHVDGHDS